MSVLDITTGMGFIAELSNCPLDIKKALLEIYFKANEGTLNSRDANAFTEKMRQKVWTVTNKESDEAKFASALMMIGTQLCIILENKEAMQRKEAAKEAKANKKKTKTQTSSN